MWSALVTHGQGDGVKSDRNQDKPYKHLWDRLWEAYGFSSACTTSEEDTFTFQDQIHSLTLLLEGEKEGRTKVLGQTNKPAE